MKRTAEGIDAAFGASVDVKWYPYLPVVNNDDTLEKLVTKAAEDLSYQVVEAEQSPGEKILPYISSMYQDFLYG